jgi:hypothetical protein
MVLDMEGDLGVQLILGQPFQRDVKARIDVKAGEIFSSSGSTTYSSSFNTGKSNTL